MRGGHGTAHRLSVLLGLVIGAVSGVSAQETPLGGNPFRGRELLSEKLCTQCHSIWGHGGQLAPDMSTAVAGKSWLDLVGDFWNHTPRMIDAMERRGHAWPTLDQSEMADLLSYLYYLRLFDRPGDAARGAIAYSQHKCSNCHSLGGKGGGRGGPLDRFSAYPSSVMLAQAMWNAGPRMQRDQLGQGTAIPTFLLNEIADLQAYIRDTGIRRNLRVELLPLPDPARGARVFRAKRCNACHRPDGKGLGPELGSAARGRTVSEIAGVLWNHSYAMYDQMRAAGIPFPSFRGSELADLISHLYSLSFAGRRGSPKRGAVMFAEKGCASCHRGPSPAGGNLAGSTMTADSTALSAAMWNHAPEMHALMAERAVAWPRFDLGEMEHLAAYLRSIAKPGGTGGP
jgi:cytochrome c2